MGREASAFRKLRSVQLVRRILDLQGEGASAAACRSAALELRATPELCRTGLSCYYPEVRPMLSSPDPIA